MGETKLCYGCMEPLNPSGHCLYCGYTANTPSSPDYIKPGTMLHERYLIGVLLGYNGEGATYLAYDTVIGCKVLVREFMPRGLCARVKNAATISVQYNNLAPYKALMVEFTELNKSLARQRTLSNINPVLDLLAENNTTYAVFEYIEGIKLIDYLKDNAGELTWNQVKEMLPPLFTTLSLVHNAGVLHRGISPETIYVTEKGALLLSAFCISGVRTANTELKSEIFQGYAAPEQYSTSASNRHGTWTDVYGICAVLYRILTGCMPTSADSRLDNDNLCAPHELNPSVPEQVSRTIMDGLMLNGQDRISTVTELVTRLFETKSQTNRMQIPAPSVYSEDDALTKPIPVQREEEEAPAAGTSRKLKTEPFDAYADLEEEEEVSLLDRIKIPVVIGVLMLAVLAIVVVVMIHVFDREESNVISAMSETSSVEDVVPVTSEAPEDESQLYDSEMFNLVGYNFEMKKEEYKSWFNLIGEEEFNDEYAAGLIFEQEILPGEPFNTGDDIHVKVSLGPAECEIPDYEGMLLSSYVSDLKKLGILNIKETELETQYYESGYVCGLALKVKGEKKDCKPGDIVDLREEYELTVYYAKAMETTTTEATTTAAPETTTTVTTTTTAAPEPEPPAESEEPGEPMEGDLPGIEQYD